MSGSFVFRGVLALLLIAVIVAAGAYVYNAGVTQGAASGITADGVAAPYYYRPFGGFGFGFFCFAIFFLWFIVGGVFRMFGFRRWGRGWYGHESHGDWQKERMAKLDEWHRQQHEASKTNE